MQKKQLIALITYAMRLTITQAILVAVFTFAGYGHELKGQEILDTQVTLLVKDAEVKQVLSHINLQTGVRFIYSSKAIQADRRLTANEVKIKLSRFLDQYFKPLNIDYKVVNNKVLLFSGEDPPTRDSMQMAALFSFARIINGVVTDLKGQPLAGVSITLKGTSTGTTTNEKGEYRLEVPDENAVLEISYTGYLAQSIAVTQNTINIKLAEDDKSLEQVVVTGYGSQRKGDLTGSVAIVDMKKFNANSSGQISKALQGMASGVTMSVDGQPGSAPSIRIRGVNTFGNNQPLYIVDGVPTQNIENMNPGDIASIQVLKDASANSIYGARASNGVIIVTTKKGSEGVQFNFNSYVGYEIPLSGNVWNILSPIDMAKLKWRALSNSNINPRPDPQYGNGPEPVLPYYILPNGKMEGEVDESTYYLVPEFTGGEDQWKSFTQIVRANHAGTNWYDETFNPAWTTNNEFSVSGRTNIGSFLFSLNHLHQQGTLLESFLKRTNMRINSQFNVARNFRIGENIFFSTFENPQLAPDWEGVNFGLESYRTEPIIPVYDIMGNFAGTRGLGLTGGANEVATRYRTRNNQSRNYRIFGNAFVEWDIMPDLTAKSVVGGEVTFGSSRRFSYPAYEGANGAGNNSFSAESYTGFNWVWTNTLTYKKKFGDVHNFTLLAGTEAYRNKGERLGGATQTYYSFDPDFTNLSTGNGVRTNFSNYYEDALLSMFGRLDYNYDGKYILSLTLRRDGSSKFLDYRWGTFPAASVGWRVSQENFMQDVSWVQDLRLTFGYGVVGNQLNVDPNNPYTLFGVQEGSYYAVNGATIQSGFAQSSIGNPAARWEKNINGNIGVNASLWGGKLNVVAEYYWKDVRDLLYNPLLLATAGAAAPPFVNIANMRNQGVDLSLSTGGNLGTDLRYSASLNFTTYKNEILKISNSTNYFSQERRRGEDDIIRNQVGGAVSSFFGYKIEGFWDDQAEIDAANDKAPSGTYQNSVAIGRFRYADINNDGQITPDDRTTLGNPNPDFTYGLNLGLEYKNFDFNAFFYGSQGNEIWNQVRWWTDFYPSGGGGAKSYTALYESWTPDNKNAKVSIQESTSSFSTSGVPNSYFVENGSFFKLKNVLIGYTLPQSFIRRLKLTKCRVYFQGSNIFAITKYTGLDPEITFGGSTNFGIDEGGYRAGRQLLLGINLTF